VHLIPERARERILVDIAGIQLEDGSTHHQYQPLTKRGNNDVGSASRRSVVADCLYGSIHPRNRDFSILDERAQFDNVLAASSR
jgi:cellobiose phosphorylase